MRDRESQRVPRSAVRAAPLRGSFTVSYIAWSGFASLARRVPQREPASSRVKILHSTENPKNMRFHDVAACVAFALVGSACGSPTPSSPSVSPPAGCTPDSALVCLGGGDGWTCSAGDNPEAEVAGLSCSVPQADGANDDFCCISWTYSTTTCTPDDDLTAACDYPSYGYKCESGDNPDTLDSSLNCSAPTPDPDGVDDDFCCQ
jgi:hypothetical protein